MKTDSKLNKNNYKDKTSSKKNFIEQGFTFLEFILVVTLLGITSTLIIPFFKTSLNNSRQKEASLIVSSMIKSTQSHYGIYGFIPQDIGQLFKFANFQKCIAEKIEEKGNIACKNSLPIKVGREDKQFYSPSGNYKIELKMGDIENEGSMFLVKANPNGGLYAKEGSAVIGCYSPISGISFVKEYSSKKFDRGPKSYLTCGVETKVATAPPFCELNPNDPECNKPIEKFCDLNPNDPECNKPIEKFCDLYPKDPECNKPIEKFCDLYPNDPECNKPIEKFCDLYPNDPECNKPIEDFCDLYPNDPECNKPIEKFCDLYPNDPECNKPIEKFCDLYPNDPVCNKPIEEFCDLYPNDPECNKPIEDFCDLYPNDPECNKPIEKFCDLYPNDPECNKPIDLNPTASTSSTTSSTSSNSSSPIPKPTTSNSSSPNPKVRNSIESNQETNKGVSLNQINVTKITEGITSINKKQKIKENSITESELDEDKVEPGPIPPWIR